MRKEKKSAGAGPRLVSVLLAVVLTATMVPAIAFASGEEVAVTKDRIASEATLDLASEPFKIATLDAQSIQAVKVGDTALDALQGDYTLTADALEISATGATKLSVGTHELAVTFAEDEGVVEETATLQVVDSTPPIEEVSEGGTDVGVGVDPSNAPAGSEDSGNEVTTLDDTVTVLGTSSSIGVTDITFAPETYMLYSGSEPLKVSVNILALASSTDTDVIELSLKDLAADGNPEYFNYNAATVTANHAAVDAAHATVSCLEGDYTLTIPFTSTELTLNSSASITITIPFNDAARSTYDGVTGSGVNLLTVSDTGASAISKTLVSQGGRDDRTMTSNPFPTPVVLGGQTPVYAAFNNINESYWLFKQGSTIRFEFTVPEGATIIAQTGTDAVGVVSAGITADGRTAWQEWSADKVSGKTTIGSRISMIFPDTQTFHDPNNVCLEATATYTLANELTPFTKTTSRKATQVRSATGTMTEMPINNIYQVKLPESSSDLGTFSGAYFQQDDGLYNESDAPLKDVVYTVHNNPDASGSITGSKAKYWAISMVVLGIAEGYKMKTISTAFIHDADGSFNRTSVITSGALPLNATGTAAWLNNKITASEYIEKIEIRFQYCYQDGEWKEGLAPWASMTRVIYYSSFENGLDHTGAAPTSDGQGDYHDSIDIPQEYTLSWFDSTADSTKTKSYTGNAVVTYDHNKKSYVITNNASSGDTVPSGGTINTRIWSYNACREGTNFGTVGSPLMQPVYYIGLPKGYTIDPNKNTAVKMYWSENDQEIPGGQVFSVSGAPITIDGYSYYKLEMTGAVNNGQGIAPLATTTSLKDRFYFNVNIDTPAGLAAQQNRDFSLRTIAYDAVNPNNHLKTGDAQAKFNNTSNILGITGDAPDYLNIYAYPIYFNVLNTSSASVSSEVQFLGQGSSKVWTDANVAGVTGEVQSNGTTSFRIKIQNTGNAAIKNFELYDLLPQLGETTNFTQGNGAVTNQWTATLESLVLSSSLSSSGYIATPTYSTNRQDGIDGLTSGGGTWSASPTGAEAVKITLNKALAAGDYITLEGTFSAGNFTAEQILARIQATNAFGVKGTFADSGSSAFGPFVYTQTFIPADAGTASIAGLVYKDLDGSGSYVSTTDEPLAQTDAVVELYKGGTAVGNYIDDFAVGANGTYNISSLTSGTYYLRYPLSATQVPNYTSTNTAYSGNEFVEVVLSTGQTATDQNIGIKRTGSLAVDYKHGATVVQSSLYDFGGGVTPISDFTAAKGAYVVTPVASLTHESHTDVPVDTSQRTGSITWDNPVQTLEIALKAQSYTISYKNSDDGAAASASTAFDATPLTSYDYTHLPYTLPEPSERTNMVFIGWTCAALSLTTPTLDYAIPANTSGNLDFVANWETGYAITYNGLEGSSFDPTNPNPLSYRASTSTITLQEPTKDGYAFTGWTGSNGVTPQKNVQIVKGSTGDKTYTANWTGNTYGITYEGLPAGVTNTSNPSSYTTGASDVALVAPGNNEGYTFTGWTIKLDDVTNGSDPTKLSVVNGLNASIKKESYGAMIATASWAPKDVAITYNVNGGNAFTPASGSTSAKYDSVVSNPGTPTRTGYTFRGWANLQVSSWQFGAGGTAVTTANGVVNASALPSLTLIAQWQINTHMVTYYGNNNTSGSAPAAVTQNYGSYVTVAGQGTLARSGYSFSGWATSPTGPVVYGASASLLLQGNVSLYAVWTLIPVPPISTFSVTYAAGGANVSGLPSGQTGLAQGSSVTVGAAPSRTGFSFTGWNSSQGGTYQPGSSFSMPGVNVVLTASWAPLTFTITFVDGQGTTLQTSTVNYGEGVTPPANPTRAGYTFVEWDKDPSAWTNVTADAVITATWNNEVFTPSSTTTTTTPTGGNTQTPIEALAQAAEEQGIPSIGVPLAAPEGFAAWALANLVLAILGVVMAAMFLLARRMRKEDDADEQERREREDARYAHVSGSAQNENDSTPKRRRSAGWIITAVVLALVGVVLFVLTQDISLPMVWVDFWTIFQAVLLIATAIVGSIAIGRKKARKEDDSTAAQTV